MSRYMEARIERRGLRPGVAAAILASGWAVAVVVFGVAEHLLDRETFDTVWLGMWWATQTVTTVGYGDVIPDPGAGKLIATVLMIGGLALFAVITGIIASAFVARAQAQRRATEDPLAKRLDEIAHELAAVRKELGRLSDGRGGRP
jgi:voltage-gated potassium channel